MSENPLLNDEEREMDAKLRSLAQQTPIPTTEQLQDPDVQDYAQRVLMKLMTSDDGVGPGYFELEHGDELVVDAKVALDEDEGAWLTEFMNRIYRARP